MRDRLKRLLPYALLVVLVVGAYLAWFNRWAIHDFLRLRGYTPPARIVQLANDTTMTPGGSKLFYVYRPEFIPKESLSEHCKNSEVTIVLGCYVDGQGIYISDITEDRLAGILQVTSAHEMLHAAYERLSKDERTRINKLLEQAFTGVTNERIKANVEEYRLGGADVTNELHSILGSEVRELPEELENYYKRYFSNRSKVVEYSEKYETAFTKAKQEVERIDSQLAVLKEQIDSTQSSLDELRKQIEEEQKRLDDLRASGRTEEYNDGVPGFNSLVNRYNSQVFKIRGLIDRFNELVRQRNELAVEQNNLYEAIDSRPDTIN